MPSKMHRVVARLDEEQQAQLVRVLAILRGKAGAEASVSDLLCAGVTALELALASRPSLPKWVKLRPFGRAPKPRKKESTP